MERCPFGLAHFRSVALSGSRVFAGAMHSRAERKDLQQHHPISASSPPAIPLSEYTSKHSRSHKALSSRFESLGTTDNKMRYQESDDVYLTLITKCVIMNLKIRMNCILDTDNEMCYHGSDDDDDDDDDELYI